MSKGAALLKKAAGRTVKQIRYGIDDGSEDGPMPIVEIEFTDGSQIAICLELRVPLADVIFHTANDKNTVGALRVRHKHAVIAWAD